MALDGFDLRARLARLEHRVQVLELQLSARDQAGALGTEQPPAPKEMNPSTEEIYPSTVAIPLEAADEPPASPPFLPITRKEPPTPRPAFDWEKLIGMRLFAALGAVIVVIGVGLFLKLAYDRGWMNLIPPATKCISGAVFGVLLLGAGEFLRRKWGAIASVGVSAAGLGVLFASVFAAHGVYHLMHPAAAFVLLAAVASVGFVVAARGRLASIAVLALVAAYINPIIIDEPNPGAWTRPVYLFVILCTGLSLSAWRAKPFRVLRGLVWWGTLLFGTAWVLGPGLAHLDARAGAPRRSLDRGARRTCRVREMAGECVGAVARGSPVAIGSICRDELYNDGMGRVPRDHCAAASDGDTRLVGSGVGCRGRGGSGGVPRGQSPGAARCPSQ
jgi:uncharacterized membrane protein